MLKIQRRRGINKDVDHAVIDLTILATDLEGILRELRLTMLPIENGDVQ